MFAPAFARCLSLAALGVACGCAAPSLDDTASPAGEARDEPTAEARSALGGFVWTRAASLGASHPVLVAAVLDDGRIFVTGSDGQDFAPEIYDPWADTWAVVAAPPQNYFLPTAAPLPGNRVLVVSAYATDTYVYDVELDTWSQIGDTSAERDYPVEAVPLEDGRVLVAGRELFAEVTSVEVFDPVDLTFVSVGALSSPRSYFTATRLLDGRVLFAGGVSSFTTVRSFGEADIFDPQTGQIEPAGPLPEARVGHNTVVLPETGEVLVFGGGFGEFPPPATATAGLYDPTSGTWTAVDDMHAPRMDATSAYMPLLGRVIVTGGDGAHAESFDPVSKHWEEVEPMLVPRRVHKLVPLPQGWLLAVGGLADGGAQEDLASTEIFGPLGAPCAGSSDCGPGALCADGVCCATACDGVCETCAGPTSLGRCRWQFPGQDLRGECDEGCNAACNGAGQCAFTPVGEPCSPPRCSDDPTHLLAPAVCGEDRTCVDPSPSPVDCAPYRCGPVDGRPACKTRCDSLSDCAPGHVCDLQGRCVPPPPLEPPASCSAAPASGERGARVLWAAGLFVLLALGRRRARGRREAAAWLVCALGLSACAAPDITKEADGQLSPRPAGEPAVPAEAAWYPVTLPGVLRDDAALVTLPDGSVLTIGGCQRIEIFLCPSTPLVDRFDPVTRQWEPQPDLPYAIDRMQAVLLDDGRVLVAGGQVDGVSTAAAAVRDPGTGMWASLPPMSHARMSHAMVRLLDGRVLVAGGVDESLVGQASVEIFDPVANGWSPAPPMAHARDSARATLVAGGDVVVVGAMPVFGQDMILADQASALVERFDPTSQAWSALPPLQQRRWAPAIVALLDGRLLVLGDLPPYADEQSELFAEVFDPRDSMWAPVSGDDTFPYERFTTTLLPGGRVLVAGGDSSKAWLFDPATKAMWPAGSTLETHPYGGAALVPGHGVLLFDGQPPELYTALGAPCAAEADCLGSLCVVGACCPPSCECGTCSPAGCSLLGAPEKKDLSVCEASCVGATRERRPVPCDIHSPECLYEETDCVAYRCDPATGGCRTGCDGPADCADGFACTVERRCVVPPSPASTASCSAAPRAPGGAASELLATSALAAACALRGRRGVRRGAARERERGPQGRPKSSVQ